MKDVQIDGGVSGRSRFFVLFVAMRTAALFVPVAMFLNIVLEGRIGIV